MAASPSRRVSTGERLNSAETTGKLQQILAQRGLRMTKQRRVILQVMDTAEQHLDVDQILARAQKIDSGVHLVTVYRTIDLLKKQGLIDELDLLHLRGDELALQIGERFDGSCHGRCLSRMGRAGAGRPERTLTAL